MAISFKDTRRTIGQHMLADGMSPIIDLEKSIISKIDELIKSKEIE